MDLVTTTDSSDYVPAEQRIEKLKKSFGWKKWAIGLGGVFLLGPMLGVMFTALLGVAFIGTAIVIAGAATLAAVHLTPVYINRLQTKKIDLILEDAKRNPIATAMDIYLKEQQALSKSKDAIAEFDAAVRTYDGERKSFKRQYPNEPSEDMDGEYANLVQLLSIKMAAYQDGKAKLELLDSTIGKMKMRFKVALAANKANKLGQLDTGDIYAKIKMEAAYDSVVSQVNTAFSAIRMQVLDVPAYTPKSVPALTNQPGEVLKMQPATQRVVVERKA